MLVRIVDDKFIYLDQISTPEEDIIARAFSVRDPHYRYISGPFDGVYRRYDRSRRRLARPFLGVLLDVCRKYGLPVSVVDERPPPRYPPPSPDVVVPDLLVGVTLEQYQVDAIKTACRHEVGIFCAPTGAGKSEIMAGIAKIMNCPTVVLCDMTTVVDQLKERLELRQDESVGMFYAGRRPNGQRVIVGSLQSLVVPPPPRKRQTDSPDDYRRKLKSYETRRKNAYRLREMVGECDLLMVDECENATSNQWRKLFTRWFRGRRRYGFSGTPLDPDKPVRNLFVQEYLGPIIYKVPRHAVEATRRIIPFSYTMIAFGDESRKSDRTAYDIALREQIIENKQFHLLVKALAEKCAASSPDHGVLILVESKPLGYTLERIIDNSKFICGDHVMAERKKAIRAFENREIQVLIGGKIAKRGLDLKGGCETLILAAAARFRF